MILSSALSVTAAAILLRPAHCDVLCWLLKFKQFSGFYVGWRERGHVGVGGGNWLNFTPTSQLCVKTGNVGPNGFKYFTSSINLVKIRVC